MILEEIAQRTRERIEAEKKQCPPEELRRRAEEMKKEGAPSFARALLKEGISFICEVKKASPSKGVIAEDFPYRKIAMEYEQAGASAISCLTEPFYFQGKDEYLKEISESVSIPILRKDFTIDSYMIYQAKCLGASAVLLICAILSDEELLEYRQIAEGLGLDALVETHDEAEVERAIRQGARIIGVNNRNLKDFTVDVENSIRLRSLVPKECLFVSESGIKNAQDIERLRGNGTDAVLIGETLMRRKDKKQALQELAGEVK